MATAKTFPSSHSPLNIDYSPVKRSRPNNGACQADAVLVSLMGGGRRPDTMCTEEFLPSDDNDDDDGDSRGDLLGMPDALRLHMLRSESSMEKDPSYSVINGQSRRTIFHHRAFRKCLQVFLNKILAKCFADTGCEVNCISEEFARKIGAECRRSSTVHSFPLPIIGRELESLGQTTTDLCFKDEPLNNLKCQFFVFKELICDVIIGRNFLRETRTLDRALNRFSAMQGVLNDVVLVRAIGRTEERIECWLDGQPLYSLPDTGAEVNLISASFASTLKQETRSTIDWNDSLCVAFANHDVVQVSGRVDLKLTFSEPDQGDYSLYRLVEHPDTKQNHDAVSVPLKLTTKTAISEPFYIIDGLRENVILGETLLSTVDAYNELKDNFYQLPRNETPGIAILGKCNPWEKIFSKHRKPFQRKELTEKERFDKEYSAESDRYDAYLDSIESRRQRLEITETQVQLELEFANRQHVQWAKTNKDLLDRYCPGVYGHIMLLYSPASSGMSSSSSIAIS